MGYTHTLNDFLKELLSHDIDLQKRKNVDWVTEQINQIHSNPYLSDIAKNSLICGVIQQLQQAQTIQSQREFLLNISKGLNEASKIAEQMACKQEF